MSSETFAAESYLSPEAKRFALEMRQVISESEVPIGVAVMTRRFDEYMQEKGLKIEGIGDLGRAAMAFEKDLLQKIGDLKDLAISTGRWKVEDGLGALLLFCRQLSEDQLREDQRQRLRTIMTM